MIDFKNKFARNILDKLIKALWAQNRTKNSKDVFEQTRKDVLEYNKDIIKHLINTFSSKRLMQDIIGLMKTDLSQYIEFDLKPNILIFIDVILEIKTGKIRERVQDEYCSKCLPYNFCIATKNKIEEIRNIHLKVLNNSKKHEDCENTY